MAGGAHGLQLYSGECRPGAQNHEGGAGPAVRPGQQAVRAARTSGLGSARTGLDASLQLLFSATHANQKLMKILHYLVFKSKIILNLAHIICMSSAILKCNM